MTQRALRRVCIVGGAGFIGSHFAGRLLGSAATEKLTVYDNFSSGRERHLSAHQADLRLAVVKGSVDALDDLVAAMAGHDTVIHLASNPDIARAMTDPAVDFDQGMLLTHHVAEAARRTGAGMVLYASGSGVYGDLGQAEAAEDHGPLIPISTGASKLAGEALLASYAAMFGISAQAFRFGNVVGPRQTHGVGFGFIRRLLDNPRRVRILGDRKQSKSYIHVDDVVEAVLHVASYHVTGPYAVFNVATGDYVTVTEIAELAVEVVGLPVGSTRFEYTGGDRSWRGDVPVIRIATDRIRALGWKNERTGRQALRASMESMLADARDGRFGG